MSDQMPPPQDPNNQPPQGFPPPQGQNAPPPQQNQPPQGFPQQQGYPPQQYIPQKKGMPTWLIVLLSILGVLLVLGIGCTVLIGSAANELVNELEEAEAEALIDNEPVVVEDITSGVSFDVLSQLAADNTDLQFDEATREYLGTEVTWIGQVEDVDEALFETGRYEIRVDVIGGDSLERAVLAVTKSEALAVPKDAQIKFTGEIRDIRADFGLIVEVQPSEYSFS